MLGYGYDDISALRDMFDGGGAGQAGDEFQGGGILSLLANMLASPYGSQQEDDQLARRIAGQASPRPQMAPDSSMRPQMRPQGRPDDYMRAGQMTTGEELMSGDDVALPAYGGREEAFLLPGAFAPSGDDASLPAYGGREEAFLLPGAFEPEPQVTPTVPTDPAGPPAQPQADGDARFLANVRAGEAASMRMPGSAAPDDANAPSVRGIPTRLGEVEYAMKQFRNNAALPGGQGYMDLVDIVMDRGSDEQITELMEILKNYKTKPPRNMSAEELSRGGVSPLASTRAPGP